jgi:hypothetical protein
MTIKKLIKNTSVTDLSLFICLVFSSLILTYFYISKEQYYYYWDYSRSFEQINDLIESFQSSPFDGIGLFLISLFDDYTQLPSIPIFPFRIILGDSRLSFVYCLILVYVVPFCLVVGFTLSKIIKLNPKLIFWSSSFFSLLFPSIWIPAFRGFPDIGGSTLTALAMLVYWQDTSLKKKNQRFLIASLVGISVLFRRHFIYSVRAFIITIIIYKLFEISSRYRKSLISSLKYLKAFSFRVIHVLILFSVFAFIVITKALLINYRTLYASYETSITYNLSFYIQEFGLIVCLCSVIGFIYAFLNSSIDLKKLNFLFLFGIIEIIQWFFFARQTNIQYVTHFLLFIISGNYLLIWIVFINLRKSFRFFLISINTLSYGSIALYSMFHSLQLKDPISVLLPKKELPLYREDFNEVKSLVEYLRLNNDSDKKIYVASSSYTLNYSVFTVAEQQLFGKSVLPISRNSNVDSRDFYPLSGLLQAHYVVVALPYQFHIDPKEQTVVKVVVDAFTQNWMIAQDFTPLPQAFTLEHGVTVRIYERIRPTSFPTILETLVKMRSQVSRTPGQEPFWLDLKSEQPTAIIQEPLLNMAQVLRLEISNKTFASLLYFGKIPENIKISGLYSISKCGDASEPISFKISTLDKGGNTLTQNIKSYPNSQLSPFELQISGQNASFLKLDISVDSKAKVSSTCRAELNLLKVSPQ